MSGTQREDRGERNEERHEGQRAEEEERDEDELLGRAVVAAELEAHVQGHRVAEQETDRHDADPRFARPGRAGRFPRRQPGTRRPRRPVASVRVVSNLRARRAARLADHLLGQQHQGDRRPDSGQFRPAGRGMHTFGAANLHPGGRLWQKMAGSCMVLGSAWRLKLVGPSRGAPPRLRAMKAAEIRERFLSFFEEREHRRMPSASLVPPLVRPVGAAHHGRACSRSSPTSAARRRRRRRG